MAEPEREPTARRSDQSNGEQPVFSVNNYMAEMVPLRNAVMSIPDEALRRRIEGHFLAIVGMLTPLVEAHLEANPEVDQRDQIESRLMVPGVNSDGEDLGYAN